MGTIYNPIEIEEKWQQYWETNKLYKTENDQSKPKYYVLDMFPYPSGAGLHVGHPLGYIASDIFARYQRLKGMNVLHPMGFDSFGLPAEQYAIESGIHPAITTEQNIATFVKQLKRIGFSYDWDRELRTSDPKFYRWTQWIFGQIFNSWYDLKADKARDIKELELMFAQNGNASVSAHCDYKEVFDADYWNALTPRAQYELLLNYRLAYIDNTYVNWCPKLGTVLANDEIKDGVSERGGYPVEKKLMKQWYLRITAYTDRLLNGLDNLDWSNAIKETQRNWFGKSEGAKVTFNVENSERQITVFTTRPDTLFGVSFVVLAPELDYIKELTTPDNKDAVTKYIKDTQARSEKDRMAEIKRVSGVFTGSYVLHPFTGARIPIWIGDYVLAGYGTGAVMAVPSGDQRDWDFATHFSLPIVPIIENQDIETSADPRKDGIYINSYFINGMDYSTAVATIIEKLEAINKGHGTINYRLRDAVFSRQRYWGEPFPIHYIDDVPYLLSDDELPVELPNVDKYLPTNEGEPPLARATNWVSKAGYPMETNTMPGWAGSSWYYLRYADPFNEQTFAVKTWTQHWNSVDLYLGGDEHATGHLIYARFWCKFLFDREFINFEEPFSKLINQGKILGDSRFAHVSNDSKKLISSGLAKNYDTRKIHVDIALVDNFVLDIEAFKKWRPEYKDYEMELENGKFLTKGEVEKMSKSKYNVVNPDIICNQYGADTLRLYEMFLGPLQDPKPWDTKGIEGVHRFLKKLWRLFIDDNGTVLVNDQTPNAQELKALHHAIKKTADDIERFSLNTTVSAFMVCVNELTALKCHKRLILRDLLLIISPFAPHITEELWMEILDEKQSITKGSFPLFNADYVAENSFDYPVSINGKMKKNVNFPLGLGKLELEEMVMQNETVLNILNGAVVKKLIVVPGKIINMVV